MPFNTLISIDRQVALATLLVLLLVGSQLGGVAVAMETTCGAEGVRVLGTNSWDKLNAQVDATVDADCTYKLEIEFQHDTDSPVPTDPATQCDPTVVPPVLAADGLPYYASRWYYEKVPDYIKAATGIDHISFDYGPCGHPPIGVFTAPHYDLHTYRVTPEYRTCMTCDILPGTPVCNFPMNASAEIPQSTASGRAFFAALDVNNFPQGFVYLKSDNIPWMGGHAADPTRLPADAALWKEPVLIVGPYNGTNIFYEPMIPLAFITGANDNHYEQNVTYTNRTVENLPTTWEVHYEAKNGVVTVTMTGKSSVCQEEFNRLKMPGSDPNSSGFRVMLGIVAIILLAVFTSSLLIG